MCSFVTDRSTSVVPPQLLSHTLKIYKILLYFFIFILASQNIIVICISWLGKQSASVPVVSTGKKISSPGLGRSGPIETRLMVIDIPSS